MMKGRSWNLQGMKSIEDPWTQELKRDMRKNMKIPRKKENPEQPVIIPRITRLPAWFELTKKQSSRRNGSYDKEQCEKDL
jgi:DNA replication protein DnaD